MSRQQSVVDDRYDDQRYADRPRERRVQEVSWDQLDNIRNRELALVVPTLSDRTNGRDRDEDYAPYAQQRDERDRHTDYDRALVRHNSADDDQQVSRRRDDRYYQDYDGDESDEESSRERRRRRRRHEERYGRESGGGGGGKNPTADRTLPPHETEGRLWYSMKERREGNFVERNFDSSYDGLIAAAAGAAIGAVTVRRFAPGEEGREKTLKAIGGALVGAAAFNCAENWFRVYTEEKEERQERKEDRQRQRKVVIVLVYLGSLQAGDFRAPAKTGQNQSARQAAESSMTARQSQYRSCPALSSPSLHTDNACSAGLQAAPAAALFQQAWARCYLHIPDRRHLFSNHLSLLYVLYVQACNTLPSISKQLLFLTTYPHSCTAKSRHQHINMAGDKAEKANGATQTFDFETMAALTCALSESGIILGTKHYKIMSQVLGGKPTESALEHQFRKVKARAKEMSDKLAAEGGLPATPAKKPKTAGSGKKGAKGKRVAEINDGDDEELKDKVESESPTKKVKVKAEEDELFS
ncbi:hypothetical protein BAUCODRAFT_26568 [Baudoinia panamericana UAMH 10762]|uniref:Uncharacterized protein n=1 Tax=Baudoinia panamericana (strain UAMH 10762) TaxID=717646 RepID=M2N2P0_BAUPA|nr:uncharacterized protein BAUCODRAFT_26568 [Baudoinia panamericana UAMH 10762]EMC93244.1 hypothetical protein BAUCODRAFT_26568 [Baudoinia panamericana UAMH 10762]